MLEYLAPVIMVVAFSLMAPIWKTLRKEGMKVQAVLAISGFLTPVWFCLMVYYLITYQLTLAWAYLGIVILWVVLVVIRHSLSLYLMKYKALTELGAYSTAFSLLVSLLIDTFYFNQVFSTNILLAFGCFVLAGLLLSSSRVQFSKVSTKKTLGILAIVAILTTVFLAVYKVGLSMQSIGPHIAISQFLLALTFFLWGRKPLVESLQSKKVKKSYIILALSFLSIGIVAEAFALRDLPLSIVVISMLIPLFIFALYDLRTKELRISKKTIAAVGCIALGVLCLAW